MPTSPEKTELFRQLPSIDELLRRPDLVTLAASDGHDLVADAVRTVLGNLRDAIAQDTLDSRGLVIAIAGIEDAVARHLRHFLRRSLQPVINATGVILHTNLGRAPLSPSALDHVRAISETYSNLEFDLTSGERGKRDVHVDRLFSRLLQPPGRSISTIVVNNNAAAVLIALNTLAEGGEVIVSRGELVEIGGAFRIPDVMSKSQAVLREVGTTNRTRIADYEAAITDRTRLLLRVHRSNFEIVGFTEQPSLEELVALGAKRKIPVMEDLGSGALFDLRHIGIHRETTVGASIRAGVGLVTYSGDKLLGGPQAGIIGGDPALVARIRKNPLFRALRVDKMVYAALEATLLSYIKADYDAIPALRMMRLSPDAIRHRAGLVIEKLVNADVRAVLKEDESVIGGGAAPGSALPTTLIAIESGKVSTAELASRLRLHRPPILARVEEERLLLDLRTVPPEQDAFLAEALLDCLGGSGIEV
jgi:L-seryl-tRNA(Ser) seleniumtransferase